MNAPSHATDPRPLDTRFQPRHALVTGANRGLGLECTRQLAAAGVTVFLCARRLVDARNAAADLGALAGAIHPLALDVLDPDAATKAAAAVAGITGGELDLLVNNAGIYPDAGREVTRLGPDELEQTLRTNVAGNHRVLLAMSPLLRAAGDARVVQVSSRRGSLALRLDADDRLLDHQGPGYSTSKAALNMLSLAWAAAFDSTGVRLAIVSPGWCRTDMGGDDAELSAEQGARIILGAVDQPHGSFTGGGEPIPW